MIGWLSKSGFLVPVLTAALAYVSAVLLSRGKLRSDRRDVLRTIEACERLRALGLEHEAELVRRDLHRLVFRSYNPHRHYGWRYLWPRIMSLALGNVAILLGVRFRLIGSDGGSVDLTLLLAIDVGILVALAVSARSASGRMERAAAIRAYSENGEPWTHG